MKMNNKRKEKELENRNLKKFRLVSPYGRVGQIYVIQPCIDPATGQFPPHIRPVNSNGDMILSEDDIKKQSNKEAIFIPQNKMFEFESGKEFDLNNPMDAAVWEAIRHCPLIASSRDQKDSEGNYIIDGDEKRYGVAELYVENDAVESQKAVSKERNIFNAKKLIFEDQREAEGRRIMCKIIGRDMDGYADSDVTDYLLKIAERMPDKIIKLYTGDDFSLRCLFVEAREKNIIKIKDNAYVYGPEGQYILGMTDDQALNWMKNPNNNRILSMIKQDTNPLYSNMEEKDDTGDIQEDSDDTAENVSDEAVNSIEEAINKGRKKTSK